MNILARIVFVAGLICLSLPLFYPLWKIELVAPQYPEGLGMYIHCDKIEGYTEFDLSNINLLNHYIGMAKIEPESIPELKFMKYIIYAALALGLLIAVLGKKFLIAMWWRVMLIIGVIGVYDFNEWEREYGYNLDPKAAIKVDGMTYKPPLLGKKQLLNITAKSYPSTGGIGIALSVALAFTAHILLSFEQKKKKVAVEDKKNIPAVSTGSIAVLALIFTLASCTPEPQPIIYGTDECAFCRMKIMDKRYGAEIVTEKGKAFKFDSFECLVDYSRNTDTDTSAFALLLTTAFNNPGILTDAKQCSYLVSEKLPSPMGAFITAFTDGKAAESALATFPGTIYTYAEAFSFINDRSYAEDEARPCCENEK